VVTAADGIEAVDLTTAIRNGEAPAVDIILMDVQMPRLNGVEAASSIKAAYAADPKKPACPPIVAITANAFAEDRQRYLDGGMDDYLAKPFDAAGLKALLQRWQTEENAVKSAKPAA
jgi:two-component system, sensor histidine kinase